ncbi:MAG: hypothetical protein SV062_08430 [Thermodesulfobacteriota bacterium]|nr:hypothetical protein [Thermodesulfobacteriota bacterium]
MKITCMSPFLILVFKKDIPFPYRKIAVNVHIENRLFTTGYFQAGSGVLRHGKVIV